MLVAGRRTTMDETIVCMRRANDRPQQEKNARASAACRRAQLCQPTDRIVFSVGQFLPVGRWMCSERSSQKMQFSRSFALHASFCWRYEEGRSQVKSHRDRARECCCLTTGVLLRVSCAPLKALLREAIFLQSARIIPRLHWKPGVTASSRPNASPAIAA